MTMNLRIIAVIAGAAIVGLIVGVLIGRFASSSGDDMATRDEDLLNMAKKITADEFGDNPGLTKEMIRKIDPKKIREFLRSISKEPHLASTPQDDALARYIRDTWTEHGLEDVELVPYEILLSFPDTDDPNKVRLLDDNGGVIHESSHQEEVLRQEDYHPNFVHAFNGYAPKGDVTGELVYVNYGRIEDFQELTERGINVSGKICMARYGKIFRGNKLQHAEDHGALGLILFSDPDDVAKEGTSRDKVYPNTLWLPDSGIQRGTTYLRDGDPLTPSWPSIPWAFRIDESEAMLPKIPCQPIGYKDAEKFLKIMGGDVITDWKGKLPNVDYRLGPGFVDQYRDYRVRLTVNNYRKKVRSFNVIGYIKGAVEPDRYVLYGNHRDAWGYGATDAGTSTAEMLEVSRIFGKFLKEGWRPRRTVVFCSWGAEEYGLLGSFEWVEEHLTKLTERAVVYVNSDACARGQQFKPSASPLLRDLIYDVTKKIDHPFGGSGSLYDYWKYTEKSSKEPKLPTLGSGSDHAPFAFYAGITCMYDRFVLNKEKYGNISIYPAYHTGFETFYLMDKIMDPDFKIHRACSVFHLASIRYLADAAVLPFVIKAYPEKMRESIDLFKKNGIYNNLRGNDTIIVHLDEAIDNFSSAADRWQTDLSNIDRNNPLALRAANDVMMTVERIFIMPNGLPGRPQIRHAVFAPSKFDSYSAAAFPGISDLLFNIDKLNSDELADRWKQVRRHVSDLYIMVTQATELLLPIQRL